MYSEPFQFQRPFTDKEKSQKLFSKMKTQKCFFSEWFIRMGMSTVTKTLKILSLKWIQDYLA